MRDEAIAPLILSKYSPKSNSRDSGQYAVLAHPAVEVAHRAVELTFLVPLIQFDAAGAHDAARDARLGTPLALVLDRGFVGKREQIVRRVRGPRRRERRARLGRHAVGGVHGHARLELVPDRFAAVPRE